MQMSIRYIAGGLFLIIVVVVLVLFSYTRIQSLRIEEMYPAPGEYIVTEGGVEIHYLRAGSGVPVVLLHGRDGTLHEFTFSLFNDLSKTYDTIALDRPGYGYSGYSGGDSLTTEAQAKRIHEVLTALEVEKPLLIGHSYGGAVMLQYILKYPQEVLAGISLGGVAYMEEPPEEGIFALPRLPVLGPFITHTLVMPLGRYFAERIYEQAFWPGEPPREYLDTISSLYLRPKQFTATAKELAVMYDSVQGMSNRYGEIAVPVTIIFGRCDQMLDYKEDGQQLYEALPEARLILVEEGGHKVHHTHTDLVLQAVGELIEQLEAE